MLIFYAYSDVVGVWQFWFGFGVLVREFFYVVCTIFGLYARPAFLLFSPAMADWHERLLYFAMPEKFVVVVCWPATRRRTVAILFIFATDICGVLALIFG